MDQILNSLFNRELDPMYPYLTYQDFLNACGLAEEDLNLGIGVQRPDSISPYLSINAAKA